MVGIYLRNMIGTGMIAIALPNLVWLIQKILHIGRNAVYTSLANGTIRSIRIGKKYRIPKLYLLEFLYPEQKKQEGA